jgi:membrane protease YdiL (CAAX protease family)
LTAGESTRKLDVGTVYAIQVVLFAFAMAGINFFDLEWGEPRGPVWLNALAGLGLGGVSYGLVFVLFHWACPRYRSLLEFTKKIRAAVSHFGLAAILFVSALAAISEEMFFRVFLQSLLQQHTAEWMAIGVASLLFAATHGLSLIYFSVTLVFGLLLGVAFAMTNSVTLVMSWHFFYDVVSFVVLIRYPELLYLNRNQE